MGEKIRKWTVMIYLAGDNNLDSAGVADLKEMKTVGSNDDVAVVAQFDRSGPKNHTKRYFLRKGGSLAGDAAGDLGETNTGDPKVLEDFILWAAEKYPAEHYMTVIWNHGSGWDDENVYGIGRAIGKDLVRKSSVISNTSFGASLPFSTARAISGGAMKRAVFRTSVEKSLTTRGIAFDDDARDFLDNIELKKVFTNVTRKLGRKIDILGMDACLMSMFEVHYQMRDAALYCVGSEEVEPGEGWPYNTILSSLVAEPSMTPRGLSTTVVDKYVKSYKAADNVTQSACDITRVGIVGNALDLFAQALTDSLSRATVRMSILEARDQVQSYYTAHYVDIVDLCGLIREKRVGGEIKAACTSIIDSITERGMVMRSGWKGSDVKHSHGISIYFPTRKISSLYAKLDFAKNTEWDTFLKAYLGKTKRRDVP